MWKKISMGIMGLVIVAALMQPQAGNTDYISTSQMTAIDSSRVLLDSLVALEDSMRTLLDSLQTLASAPEPRTYVADIMIAQSVDSTHMDGGNAYPAVGTPLDGVRELYILLSWANFDAGSFTVEFIVGVTGTASADTLFCMGGDALTAIPLTYTLANASHVDTGGMRLYPKGLPDILHGYGYIRVASTDVPGDFDLDISFGRGY